MKNSRNTILGLILIGIIVAAFLVPRLVGSSNDDNGADNNAGSGTVAATPQNSNVHLGNVVAASQVDRDGCAVQSAATLPANAPFYVVAQDSDIPAGTTVFVRLYHNNQPVEDAPEIRADQDYFNTCVNFVFEPINGTTFDRGDYEAEFIVNGNQSDLVAFQIQ